MLFAIFITGNLSRYCDLLYNISLSLFPLSFPPLSIPPLSIPPLSFPPLSIPLSFHASSIQCDMDERSNRLIGAHGYCTQVYLLGDGYCTQVYLLGDVREQLPSKELQSLCLMACSRGSIQSSEENVPHTLLCSLRHSRRW